jgi:type IX secretion system PorP/SprF family membrane protein
MKNFCGALLILFVVLGIHAQEPSLPGDFRQQNLTDYNSSLLNPAYSLDRNNPSSIAFWSRWQWQTIDADPTSLFLNYTTRINPASSAAAGFFQHNTGIFLNTGAALNYAYQIELSPKMTLGVGLNLFGYQQELADQRFIQPNPLQRTPTNDFILQLAPGINLRVDKFSLGFVSENLFDYNFTTNERNTSPDDRMFFGLASYDIPVGILNADGNSFLRPAVYFKTIPGLDTQIGFNSVLSTSKFWAQGGYNSFYGVSGGAGGRFFKRLSIGAIVEFGIGSELDGKDPSFEIVTAYKLGKIETAAEKKEEELIAAETEKEKELKEELSKAEALAKKEKLQEQRRLDREQKRLDKEITRQMNDSIQVANRNAETSAKESRRELKRKTDSINAAKTAQALAEREAIAQQRKTDSIQAAKKAEETALALARQKRKDSIAQAQLAAAEAAEKKAELERLARQKEVVTPEAGEKYEEVVTEGLLEPGYYLIANVFGTKRYFYAFMADLKKKGLAPKSFYRELNKYNYVYLKRYDSINEARKARDSKFNGQYSEKTWIFRVVGE